MAPLTAEPPTPAALAASPTDDASASPLVIGISAGAGVVIVAIATLFLIWQCRKAAREERDQPVLPMKHEDREYPSLRFYYGGAWDGQYGGYHGSDKASDPPPLLRGWFDDKPPKDRSSSVGSGSTLKGDDEPVVKCVSRPPPLVVHG